jgi:hypothetical protein
MTDQQQRLARTESLFRDVNERIAESAERFDAPNAEFVCECSDQNCTERLEATSTSTSASARMRRASSSGRAMRMNALSAWSRGGASATRSWRSSTAPWRRSFGA